MSTTLWRRILPATLASLAIALSTSQALAQMPAKPQDHPVALVGATVHPVSAPAIEHGTILFDKGKIVAIGGNVSLPPNAEKIDLEGKHIYPGLISSATGIGLTEIEAVRATQDIAESDSLDPGVRAQVAFNPESELIPVARANGITLAATTPQARLVGGMSAMMMLDGWTWEEMTLKAPLALNISWPAMFPAQSRWTRRSEEEQKKERDRRLEEIAGAFRNARAYMLAKAAEADRGVPYHDVDVRWEAMIPVLEGKVPVVVWAYDVAQIEAAVAWADREQVKLIIGGGYDAWRVADMLKARGVAVLAGGLHRLPLRRFEEYDEPEMLPGKLYAAGIPFAIITEDESAHERNLPYQAARAAAYGLPKDEALKAITLSPAKIFGIDDRVGSLEVGKDATLIVTTGDPLEIRSSLSMEFIRGRKVDLTSRHTRLYEKYLEKYRRLKP